MKKIIGFTITELVIVIAVLAIISLFIFLRSPGKSIELRAQAEQVAHDIRYAQSLAMARNADYRINITTNNYVLQDDQSNNIVHPATGNNNVINFANSFTASSNCIEFNGRGIPANCGTTSLTNNTVIVSGGNHSYTITINSETGHVSVS